MVKIHEEIIIELNDPPVTDEVTLKLRLDKTISDIVRDICADQASKCDCETCKSGSWEHFFASILCSALEAAMQHHLEHALKNKFKGNTRVTSNAVN
jgi:hypothetical protein